MEQKLQKFLSYLKNRIKTKSTELARIIFSAFYISLLIYYITPLYKEVIN